jgi:hypothetical protein
MPQATKHAIQTGSNEVAALTAECNAPDLGVRIALTVPDGTEPVTSEEIAVMQRRAERIRARVALNNAFPTRTTAARIPEPLTT